MVKIRLARAGTKKRPFYRIVAADSRKPATGGHIEVIGTYDPMNLCLNKDNRSSQPTGTVTVKTERIRHWMTKGAQLTDTVKSILKRQKIDISRAA